MEHGTGTVQNGTGTMQECSKGSSQEHSMGTSEVNFWAKFKDLIALESPLPRPVLRSLPWKPQTYPFRPPTPAPSHSRGLSTLFDRAYDYPESWPAHQEQYHWHEPGPLRSNLVNANYDITMYLDSVNVISYMNGRVLVVSAKSKGGKRKRH
ncbi:hypothetical protein BKA70DRAFT_1223584 [Coprinopsis sp. MPI-PUGE-AT-0042]|nr:hypothetical protein BKA70DRAFT_1223584 [Coprinopsis sp. MPI-PUGE-AT-0042]